MVKNIFLLYTATKKVGTAARRFIFLKDSSITPSFMNISGASKAANMAAGIYRNHLTTISGISILLNTKRGITLGKYVRKTAPSKNIKYSLLIKVPPFTRTNALII